jgi:hypothetical protein
VPPANEELAVFDALPNSVLNILIDMAPLPGIAMYYIEPVVNHGDCKVTTGGLIWLAMLVAKLASKLATCSAPIAVVTHSCTTGNVNSSNGMKEEPVVAGTACVPIEVDV